MLPRPSFTLNPPRVWSRMQHRKQRVYDSWYETQKHQQNINKPRWPAQPNVQPYCQWWQNETQDDEDDARTVAQRIEVFAIVLN